MNTHLTSLNLHNFRKFREFNLELHPQLCVFLGDNGTGKTTILDAIVTAISTIFPSCNCIPKIPSLNLGKDDLYVQAKMVAGKSKNIYASQTVIKCGINCFLKDCNPLDIQLAKYYPGIRQTIKELLLSGSALAQAFNEHVDNDSSIPVFAYYGPHRGAKRVAWMPYTPRKIDYSNPFSAYKNALKPSLSFDAFIDWFNKKETIELRNFRDGINTSNKELQAVREAISLVFSRSERKFSNPHFTPEPDRLVIEEIKNSGDALVLDFNQLSDGYRGVIALVADFARRLALANQYSDIDPLQGHGVLIIDEIDAHLHPKWQYNIIEDLQRAFPNVQLIVSTHSTEIVSTVDKNSIYILSDDEDATTAYHPEHQTKGHYLDYIAGTTMGTPENPDRDPAFRAYLRCLALIQQDKTDSDMYKDFLKQVIAHYEDDHPLMEEIQSRYDALMSQKEIFAKYNK